MQDNYTIIPVDCSLGSKVGEGVHTAKCVVNVLMAMMSISHNRTPGCTDIKEHMIVHECNLTQTYQIWIADLQTGVRSFSKCFLCGCVSFSGGVFETL